MQKNVLDFHAWVRLSGLDPDGLLNDAFGVIEQCMKKSTGDVKTWAGLNYKLPLNLPSRKLTSVAISDTICINENMDPVPDYVEKLTINMLATNINNSLGAGLDCDPYAARPEKTNTKVCLDVLTIGGHHAEAVSRALADRGATVQHLSMPNYRVSAVHCGKIEDALKTLKVSKDTILVLQVFDSGFYMVRTEEGSLIPPCKRGEGPGTYHIDGVLELLNRESQFDMFRQLIHEFTGFKENVMIFLAPLPCYVEAGCCEDVDHVSNRLQPDFLKKMEEGVFSARQNIKNFAFRMGIRSCHTISTWGKLRKMEKLWTGPTTVRDEAYPVLAEAVLEAVDLAKKKRPGDNLEDEQDKKRPRGQQTGSIHGADLGGQHTGNTYGAGFHGRGGQAWQERQPGSAQGAGTGTNSGGRGLRGQGRVNRRSGGRPPGRGGFGGLGGPRSHLVEPPPLNQNIGRGGGNFGGRGGQRGRGRQPARGPYRGYTGGNY
jgi:hypothetical protein